MSCLYNPELLNQYIESVQVKFSDDGGINLEELALEPSLPASENPMDILEFKSFTQQQKNRMFVMSSSELIKNLLRYKSQFKEG